MPTPPAAAAADAPFDAGSSAASAPRADASRVPGASARAPIDSSLLLAGRSEVRIAHRGELYRLRQTALGKLILTK